jgi:hypothetical protein
MENQGFFFESKISPKCEKWKGFCKKMSNFQPNKKKSQNFCPHLDFNFSMVAFKNLFRWVLKTCCHLMLNPSWDASQ